MYALQMGAAHEDPNCTFVTEVGMVEGLSVAGAALSALGGASLAPSHHTVFLPNDDAFTALITTLSASQCDCYPGSRRGRCHLASLPLLVTQSLSANSC